MFWVYVLENPHGKFYVDQTQGSPTFLFYGETLCMLLTFRISRMLLQADFSYSDMPVPRTFSVVDPFQ